MGLPEIDTKSQTWEQRSRILGTTDEAPHGPYAAARRASTPSAPEAPPRPVCCWVCLGGAAVVRLIRKERHHGAASLLRNVWKLCPRALGVLSCAGSPALGLT
jgi:hypothetical protein